jgi:hypothetical protein
LEEFYIHVLAHAAVHHGRKEGVWMRDLDLLKEKCRDAVNWDTVEDKLKKYNLYNIAGIYGCLPRPARAAAFCFYSFFLEHDIPLKGHVLRFFCLPFRKKIPYLLSSLFPSGDFIKHRYSLKYKWQVGLWHVLRPFLMFWNVLLVTAELPVLFAKRISFSKTKNT